MRIGTKSVLFGAHQFILHPITLFIAWWRLYGFPADPRLWVAFIVHDIGYFGKPNMDGEEGEQHPIFGAKIMGKLFGPKWEEFTLLHSRFFAKKLKKRYSKLCVADKYAIVITPSWLYLPFVWLTGELHEYMGTNVEKEGYKYAEMGLDHSTPWAWHKSVKQYLQAWIDEHKDVDRDDTWTGGDIAN
jgi:hypothetical protein